MGATRKLFAALALVAGCASKPDLPPLEHETKGWEIHSFQAEAGVWRYALLPGTDRLKSPGEVRAAAVGDEELIDQLRRLPAGEHLFLWGAPPEAFSKTVRSLAADRDLVISGNQVGPRVV